MQAYLNAPIWRFVFGPNLCGSAPTLGVMMPSVDRVGRYFPFVIAAQLPGCASPTTVFHTAGDWFEAAEALILTTLDDDFDFDKFDVTVSELGMPKYQLVNDRQTQGTVRLDADKPDALLPAYARILDNTLMGSKAPFSLWRTHGSEKVRASVLLSPGLPAPTNFAAFLDGNWDAWGWEGSDSDELNETEFPVLILKPLMNVVASARSHPGTRRRANEDALLVRSDIGIWAVADGVGGHDVPAEASHTVIQHLNSLLVPISFGGGLADVRATLEDANTALRARATELSDTAVVASTVVALLMYGGHYSIMWSGDSRGYRFRQGCLSCLTKDHVSKPRGPVTHAVGAEPSLFIESVHDKVEAGDHYLLCSDGLSAALDDDAIADILLDACVKGSVEGAAEALLQEALVAGARDNVTVILVNVPKL